MGDVFLAHQESLDRQVAVKLLPPELARDPAVVENFLKEARSAAKVSHENIVGAVDAGQAGGRTFFVMEYVPGEPLHDLIQRQKALPEAQALDFARQIARGLGHAHRHGLIHRDIKPKNILITKEGRAKICDFGLARMLREAEGRGQEELLYTTPAYASPELCRAEPSVDHRTDLYSLGVSLFEMLTGKRPFNAEKSRELMTKHVTQEPPAPRSINPAVSEGAEALVLRMLRKKPEERFADYDELLAAIEAVLQGPAKRKKLLLAGAGAAALALAAVLAVALSGGSKPPAPPPPPPATARDPEVERQLAAARALQTRAWDSPSEYPAVRAKWKELEERYRGTPHHSLFSTPLMEFEAKMSKEADAVARALLEAADRAAAKGAPADALRALRKFPEALARSEAGQRVAARVLELERALDARVQAELRACHELVTSGGFDEARARSHALRASLAEGGAELPPAYRSILDDFARRLDQEQAAALKRKPEPAKPEPEPAAVVPAPKPAPPANAPAATPAVPPSPLAAPLAVLRDPAIRAEPEKRGAAAAAISIGSKSALHVAAAHFLSRPEAEWKAEGPVAEALAEALGSTLFESAGKATLEEHLAAFDALAKRISACGAAPVEALQLFACAHASEVAARKGKVDPAVALQARLGSGAAGGLWGPPATATRIDLAGVLVRAPGLWVARAADAGAAAADFPTRYLGALCAIKPASVDPAAAAEAWKKLAAAATDPAWAKLCEGVADRIRQSAPCDACASQGKYACSLCTGTGVLACTACLGAGNVPDGGGGKITCAGCKGRKAGLCAGCNGAKSLKCAACDGKKSRALVPGGAFRPIVDLGLCDACRGTGSLFAEAAWPCPSCEGCGRAMAEVLRDFARLPAWSRGREGRSILPALRWLARHPSKEGAWRANGWRSSCPEDGCEAPAAAPEGVPGGFDLGGTALALVAFLGAGLGPDSDLELGGTPAGAVVSKALAWILAAQKPDGHIAAGATAKPVFEHLLATYALVTALQAAPPPGEKERQALREPALRAVKWALANQARGGGWGYTVQAPSDTWVTSWGGLALVAARDAGIEIPKLNLNYLAQWYEGVTDKADLHLGYTPQQMGKVNLPGNEAFLGHDTLSAFGGLVRMWAEGRATNAVLAAEKSVQRDLPNPDPNRRDFAYWHWGTVFMVQREQRKGTAWTTWSNALYREASALQETADTCALGSFPANDRWGVSGGRVYATAINALTLAYAAGLRPPAYPKAK
jgi:serine/threonine-protein kinase